MLAVIITLILSLIVAVTVTYNIMQLSSSSTILLESQINQAEVNTWKSNLIGLAKPISDNGDYALPLGIDLTNFHTLPTWTTLSNINVWNKPYIYCPFGNSSTGILSNDIKVNSTTTYNTRILNSFSTVEDGIARDYVVASESPFNSLNVMALIISELPMSDVTPSCDDVVYDGAVNAFKVENGNVTAITYDEIVTLNQTRQSTQNPLVYFENIVESDASITGNSLQSNLDYIINSGVNKSKLTIPAGNHLIKNLEFNMDLLNPVSKKRIEIELVGVGSTSIISSSLSKSLLTMKGVSLTLTNLTISDIVELNLSESKLISNNVSMGNVYLYNSNWSSYNTTINPLDLPSLPTSVYLFNSQLTVESSTSMTINSNNANTSMLNLIESKVFVSGILNTNNNHDIDTVNLTSSEIINYGSLIMSATGIPVSEFRIDNLSRMNNYGTIIVPGNSNTSIYSNGEILLNGGLIRTSNSGTNILIELLSNSVMIMNSSSTLGSATAGQNAVNSIVDNGAKNISGSGANVYAISSCWSGDIFRSTDVTPENIGQSGSGSSTTDSTLRMFNRSSWNCI
jgi:hypothetical protein